MAVRKLTKVAKRLRAEPTIAERHLWSSIRGNQLGVRFTRQHPIGGAIVDFVCRSARLAIEVDGGQHADSDADVIRTAMIERFGYRVIRFWNIDVLANTNGVLIEIQKELAIARNGGCSPGLVYPHPQPLPNGEGS